MNKITPCLWFNIEAEEAAKFYTAVFRKSKVLSIARYGEEGSAPTGRQAGSVMTVSFRLGDQEYLALNGGPDFKFNEAVSFVVHCKNQEEVDYFWEKLSAGGEEGQCGWLKDRYGVSWQIVPDILPGLLGGRDREKSERVMKAMLKMNKIDISTLKQA